MIWQARASASALAGVILVHAALFVLDPWGPPRGEAAAAPGVYHADPGHLWNRLHDAIFVRVGSDGREYGRDRLEPYLWSSSKYLLGGESHDRLVAVLAEFNRGGDALIADPVKRAMLQRDLWLVFSWLEHSHNDFYDFPGAKADWQTRQDRLREPLARAIGHLALTPQQIADLPDTYAAAAASGEFASRFDPAQPDRPYLPPDLFDVHGPWVSLGRRNDLIAPSHVLTDNPFTTSAFLVFIKLPGGRNATRAYVDRLGSFKGPRFIGTLESPKPEFPNFNPDTPQFPAGTEVALVRRALLVTPQFDVAPSPIAESVQVRVYRAVPAWNPANLRKASMMNDEARSWQSVHEFSFSRARLFAGRSGGLFPIEGAPGDFATGFSTHGVDMFEEKITPGPAPASLTWCVGCHFAPGVFSFNTFAQHVTLDAPQPGRLEAMPPADVLAAAVAWKQKRADWILLQRLIRESIASRSPRP
jgi:hypothetical protein